VRPAVVIPTFEEAGNVAAVIAGVRAALPDAYILIVDDDSPDGTASRAADAGAEVLVRKDRRGLGSAYRAGFERVVAGGFDPIYQMDADLSHDPADLPKLATGADLTLGSRYVDGGGVDNWGLGRKALSRLGSAYARTCLSVDFHDLTGGFKCWRSAALRAIAPHTLRCEGYAFQIESTWRAHQRGLRIVEVPIRFTERREGASKLSGAIAVEAAWRVLWLRTGT